MCVFYFPACNAVLGRHVSQLVVRVCPQATFMHLLTYFPTDYARITSHANWLTVQRKIVHIVRTLKREGRDIGEGFADIVGAAIANRKQQGAVCGVGWLAVCCRLPRLNCG